MIAITLGVLLTASLALFGFGVNLLFLTWRAIHLQPRPGPLVARGSETRLCVQIPIYNERYVAERVLDAVCELDWPTALLEIQVLDDSDDETSSILARRVAHWRRRGLKLTQVRRESREGFKAGALAHGLALTDAPFIAIFDADFVPPRDFLRRTLAVFDDPTVGFAQARWGHLNESYSWFTRLQALAIDFHFLVEQSVRAAQSYFTNFTGTAGVWRRTAIEDSGGWSAATLTEDLDLSYRAQLRGWRGAYLEDLVVPEELPVSIDAYRRQQSRWATGSFQSAFRLLVPILRSRNRPAVKLQAAVHLLSYGVGPLMLAQLACYPVLLLAFDPRWLPWQLADASVLVTVIGASPWIGFMVAQTRRGRPWWSGLPSVLCQVVGAGMSLTVVVAMVRATRSGGEFVRTPKHHIVQRGQEWRHQDYVHVGDPRALAEALLGVAALMIAAIAIYSHQSLVAIYACLFALGFLTLTSLSAIDFLEVVTLRGLGHRALTRLRVAAPSLVLLSFCAVLLLLTAQMPEPFEDGYAHWLIAANLASTGHLQDPLFGMQDSWLPGYHLLAGAVLSMFGLWSLVSLKVLGALIGLATLACVYGLARNRRQARLTTALLVLNPVFLFTSGSTVVEPLLTALLTGAALAAVRGRTKVAALLALLACLTATKAWIWIGATALVVVLEVAATRFRARGIEIQRPHRVPAIAWTAPAIALLIFLQLGFAPAGNSLARGSLEVFSATARGSLPDGAMGRLVELTSTFGLAALPLFALGLVGLMALARSPASPSDRARLRFIHVPALLYLGAVVALVTSGAYTGSHRYLYPALPALALLAAAALDRHAAAIRTVAVAASGLFAIAFLPVFASFASDNAGLISAGQAASGAPGVLITDSPVAAYYSHKRPADITGSQSLPSGRADAIAWMAAHHVTVLVLEDISYYRATAVFPDLAAGQVGTPFASLGDQKSYQVPNGKPVYAYKVGPAILPGVTVDTAAPAIGKTAPLAKGLGLRVGDLDAVGEGMGFGVPIVHYRDGWVYPRSQATVDLSTAARASWKRTFSLDEIGGDAAHRYAFVPIVSRGTIEVTYVLDSSGLAVGVHVLDLAPGYTEVGILNEQSAAFDDFAEPGRTLVSADFGIWVPATGDYARLRSGSLGVEWSLAPIPGAQLHAGREHSPPDFDWAGLDYTFPAPFTGATYHINVQEAK